MSGLTLEIVEGPGAGTQVVLDRPIVIGRDPGTDLVLDDGEVSREHARVSPAVDGSAVVEDLDSANGTFVNTHEVMGPARLDPGDDFLIGVTLIEVRSPQEVAREVSAVRLVPPGLATAPRPAAYANPEVVKAELDPDRLGVDAELDKFLDVRVRRRAQLAPLALFVLVAIALIIYFAAHRGGL